MQGWSLTPLQFTGYWPWPRLVRTCPIVGIKYLNITQVRSFHGTPTFRPTPDAEPGLMGAEVFLKFQYAIQPVGTRITLFFLVLVPRKSPQLLGMGCVAKER